MTHDDMPAEAGGIMPSQWNDIRGARLQTPEKRLALAVLKDGMKCYQGGGVGEDGQYRNRTARIQREAVEWIADVAADGPFSFSGCCATLGIDADYLRAGIAKGLSGPISRRSGSLARATRMEANKRRVRASSPYASKSAER
jgi:hypothetical protein